MSRPRQKLGEKGESIAADHLVAKGWNVVDRRFRSGHRDIDLVVERKINDLRMIAFVEVKTRAGSGFGGPLAAVQWRKQREMACAARDWMSRHRLPGDTFRFDVVGIVFANGSLEVVHVENAFSVR